jgi:hypothetical protein
MEVGRSEGRGSVGVVWIEGCTQGYLLARAEMKGWLFGSEYSVPSWLVEANLELVLRSINILGLSENHMYPVRLGRAKLGLHYIESPSQTNTDLFIPRWFSWRYELTAAMDAALILLVSPPRIAR